MKKRAWLCDHCRDTLKKVGYTIEPVEITNAMDVCEMCKRRTVVNFCEIKKGAESDA